MRFLKESKSARLERLIEIYVNKIQNSNSEMADEMKRALIIAAKQYPYNWFGKAFIEGYDRLPIDEAVEETAEADLDVNNIFYITSIYDDWDEYIDKYEDRGALRGISNVVMLEDGNVDVLIGIESDDDRYDAMDMLRNNYYITGYISYDETTKMVNISYLKDDYWREVGSILGGGDSDVVGVALGQDIKANNDLDTYIDWDWVTWENQDKIDSIKDNVKRGEAEKHVADILNKEYGREVYNLIDYMIGERLYGENSGYKSFGATDNIENDIATVTMPLSKFIEITTDNYDGYYNTIMRLLLHDEEDSVSADSAWEDADIDIDYINEDIAEYLDSIGD